MSEWQSATSNQQSAISQKQGKTGQKKGFNKTVIRLLNGTLAFVCNKMFYPRVGLLAESACQQVARGKTTTDSH
ncbi:MAG TPA: hypothetical protein VGN44_20165 [Candidatus Angelobacter sp.]|jgi:hypothetical protein